MPTPTGDLETTLNEALAIARANGQSEANLEHLALALAADAQAAEVLQACSVDIDTLKASLKQMIVAVSPNDDPGVVFPVFTVSPNAAFIRTVQRAVDHARFTDREPPGGAGMLIALLNETEGAAARLLHDAGIMKYDAMLYVSHGVRKGQRVPTSYSAEPSTAAPSNSEEMGVLLLNDDYTPMEFVVGVLRDHFDKDEDDAWRLMREVHQTGWAECGIYLREEATATVAAVMKLARDQQHPLLCVMEPTRGRSDALIFSKPRTVVASGARDRKRA